MTVQFHPGKATVPLWAAITLIASIFLGTVGWIIAANKATSNAEHMAIINAAADLKEFVVTKNKDQDEIIDALRISSVKLQNDMDYVKTTVVKIERKLGF